LPRPSGTFRGVGQAIRLVIDHARRNGGVVSQKEAIALGMSKSTLRRRVAEGVFIDLRPGLLAIPGAVDELKLDLWAACSKLNAVVSHESAAHLHGLDRPRFVKRTVSVPVRRSKDLVGVTVHQLTDLAPDHIVDLDGLPVTSPERTIMDLAAVLREGHLARILDNSLAARQVDFDALESLFASLGRRGKPGTALLRKMLEARGSEYTPPDGELERRLILVLQRAELPEPVRQFRAPWLRPVNGRVDLAYPAHRLVIEGDSRRWHQLMEAFENDRLRDNAAQLAGWRILRFTWAEITDSPERVASTVRRALED
jgi:very-short-patch-repair endonuclease